MLRMANRTVADGSRLPCLIYLQHQLSSILMMVIQLRMTFNLIPSKTLRTAKQIKKNHFLFHSIRKPIKSHIKVQSNPPRFVHFKNDISFCFEKKTNRSEKERRKNASKHSRIPFCVGTGSLDGPAGRRSFHEC